MCGLQVNKFEHVRGGAGAGINTGVRYLEVNKFRRIRSGHIGTQHGQSDRQTRLETVSSRKIRIQAVKTAKQVRGWKFLLFNSSIHSISMCFCEPVYHYRKQPPQFPLPPNFYRFYYFTIFKSCNNGKILFKNFKNYQSGLKMLHWFLMSVFVSAGIRLWVWPEPKFLSLISTIT